MLPLSGYHALMLTLSHIRDRLQLHEPPALPTITARRAAVAVILRGADTGAPEILFIRRAERDGDPWSGHMAFPGGHAEDSDASLAVTAARETHEEIGLDLGAHGELIGRIEHEHAAPANHPNGMLVAPFVFVLTNTPPLQLNYEVAEVVWTPLQDLVAGDSHTRMARHGRIGVDNFPGYVVTGGHFVWGLTYRMLHRFLGAVEPRWQPPR